MVRDSWRSGINDAQDLLEIGRQDYSNRVSMTNLVHSIIRANDALLLSYGEDKPSSHEEAARKFTELVDSIGLYERYGRYEKNIRDILSEKTSAEYTGKRYRDREVEDLLKKTERFFEAVKDIIDRSL